MKFKVGDLIIGKVSATKTYSTTIKGWVGKVSQIDGEKFYATSPVNNESFWLRSDHFRKFTKRDKIVFNNILLKETLEGYNIRYSSENDTFRFGCGSVELTRDQINIYRRYLLATENPKLKEVLLAIDSNIGHSKRPDLEKVNSILASVTKAESEIKKLLK